MRNLILTLIIWTICFTAITVGVSLSYKWYRHMGTDISIHFHDVSGLVPNQSKVMYLGVQIGSVNKIDLDENGIPFVEVRISRSAVPLLGSESKFWIVRPEFNLGGISNLSAISTGDYISVHPVPGKPAFEFWGIEDSPVENEFDAGLRVILKGMSASGIDIGSGVMYHDLQIGEVGEMGLAKDNRNVELTVFIDRKYAHIVRKGSYFGNISGFHADIHIFGGSKITLNSIRTLVKGGIKIESPNLNSPQARDGDIFRLLSRDELNAKEDRCD